MTDKKSGRKWPRPNDTESDIIPVPGSQESALVSYFDNCIVAENSRNTSIPENDNSCKLNEFNIA